MAQHKAIDRWAIKKFGLPYGSIVRIEQEKRNDGYCETCSYEYDVVEVYVKTPDSKKEVLHTTIGTSLAEIMNEILDASLEENTK